MGVVAQDVSRISQPVNNPSYGAGQGASGKTVVPVIPPSATASVASKTSLVAAESAIANARGFVTGNKIAVAVSLLSTAYDALSSIYNSLSSDDPQKDIVKAKMEEAQSEKQKLEYEQQTGQMTQQKQDELQDYLTRQQDAVSANAGTNLLSVLTNNGKSLVTSVGTLTSTFGEKFDIFNDYMYGLLKYMDILTGFMDKSYTLNKDLSDQAKKEKEQTHEVGDTKMTADEIKVQKDLAMMKNYQFKTSPVDQSVLESDSVVGMSPLQIEVSHRSNEVEARVFDRTATTVKDIDENVLFDIAPREVNLVKNAVTAINATDEKNFELDEDDLDIASPIDISSIFGYEKSSDIIEQYIIKMGGSIL